MKKSTREFITRLLLDEIDREIIQDNPSPREVEYVTDLVDATIDYIKSGGNGWKTFAELVDAESKIEELYGIDKGA